MHKTCIYWYKKAILHNTVYQKIFFKKKPFQTGSVVQSGLDCTNVFGPMLRWHSAQWATLGLESCPRVISLGVNFSDPRTKILSQRQVLQGRNGLICCKLGRRRKASTCWVNGPRSGYCNWGLGTKCGKSFTESL